MTWIDWTFTGESWFGVPYPAVISAALVINVVVTVLGLRHKRVVVAAFQRYVLNPPVRLLLRLGLPLGWTLLETTGRRTAVPECCPSVTASSETSSGSWPSTASPPPTCAIRSDPRVRVRVRLRRGLRMAWRPGTAHVLVDDDPYARQRWLIGWTHPLRALNAMIVRVLGTEPVTIRIDLDPDVGRDGGDGDGRPTQAAATGGDSSGEAVPGGPADADVGGAALPADAGRGSWACTDRSTVDQMDATEGSALLEMTCPRCGRDATVRFYGPCESCRAELRVSSAREARIVQLAEYEPKMNVTPNAVALKDD